MSTAQINASIVTIGDELLIGQTIDTNSAFIGQQLNAIGVWVKKRVAVGDVKEEILEAIERESRTSQIIIITGGLGPTADDITKPALCEFFGGNMVMNEEVLQHVTTLFARLGRPLIERNKKQAEVPDCCTVLFNKYGTAPGMWFKKEGVIYVSLPGVPHEMKGLLVDEVLPRLLQAFTLPAIQHKTLLTAGVGESELAEAIKEVEETLPAHIKLAYLPSNGMVKLRLTAKGTDANKLNNELHTHFAALKEKVTPWLVVDGDIPLPQVVNNLLQAKGKMVATAESCTGGYIAHLLSALPGSSASFQGSVVSYANIAKEAALGVKQATLEKQGAVSEATVTEMATGVLHRLQADYAVATSGILGPGGGSAEKPVGTVWIAVANKHAVKTIKYNARFDRKRNIEVTALFALNFLRGFIIEQEG